MKLETSLAVSIVAGCVLLSIADAAMANGGYDPAAEIVTYRSFAAKPPADSVSVVVGLPRVLFTLNSFANRYKVVTLTIENGTAADLQLSRTGDWIEFEFENQELRGVMDLASTDPGAWQQIGDDTMRKLVAYGGTIGQGATRRVFVFVDKWPVGQFPIGIKYNLKGSHRAPFELRKPPAVKA